MQLENSSGVKHFSSKPSLPGKFEAYFERFSIKKGPFSANNTSRRLHVDAKLT